MLLCWSNEEQTNIGVTLDAGERLVNLFGPTRASIPASAGNADYDYIVDHFGEGSILPFVPPPDPPPLPDPYAGERANQRLDAGIAAANQEMQAVGAAQRRADAMRADDDAQAQIDALQTQVDALQAAVEAMLAAQIGKLPRS